MAESGWSAGERLEVIALVFGFVAVALCAAGGVIHREDLWIAGAAAGCVAAVAGALAWSYARDGGLFAIARARLRLRRSLRDVETV
jgi:hypothetical protein